MKPRQIIATVALMLASLGASTAANAQRGGYDHRYEQRADKYRNHDFKSGRYYGNRGYGHRGYDRGYNDRRYFNRGHDRRWRDDRRWRGGNRWHNDRRCWTEWRYHRQVRICR